MFLELELTFAAIYGVYFVININFYLVQIGNLSKVRRRLEEERDGSIIGLMKLAMKKSLTVDIRLTFQLAFQVYPIVYLLKKDFVMKRRTHYLLINKF
jgi:hypothetical protein